MCGALWECVKCPGKVVCCCCKCACNMFLGFLFSGLVLLIIIGLIVYFTVFYHKDSGKNNEQDAKNIQNLLESSPQHFRSLFKTLQ